MYQDPAFPNEILGIFKKEGPVSGPSEEVPDELPPELSGHRVRLAVKGELDISRGDIREPPEHSGAFPELSARS